MTGGSSAFLGLSMTLTVGLVLVVGGWGTALGWWGLALSGACYPCPICTSKALSGLGPFCHSSSLD